MLRATCSNFYIFKVFMGNVKLMFTRIFILLRINSENSICDWHAQFTMLALKHEVQWQAQHFLSMVVSRGGVTTNRVVFVS